MKWIPRETICRKYNIDRQVLNKMIERLDFPKGQYRTYGDSNVLMFKDVEIERYWKRVARRQKRDLLLLRRFIRPGQVAFNEL